jgi:hypothetical protein
MTIIITDPALLDQLLRTADTVVLAGPDGTRLGTFTAEGLCRNPAGRAVAVQRRGVARTTKAVGRP